MRHAWRTKWGSYNRLLRGFSNNIRARLTPVYAAAGPLETCRRYIRAAFQIMPDRYGTRRCVPCYHHSLRRTVSGMEDEEEIPYISGSGEGLMEEGPAMHTNARRNEDIALDLMKFVAMTTGYGRTTSSGVGFQGTGSASKPDEYAAQLLELYGKCRAAVEGKK
jgi:hypothetical protein